MASERVTEDMVDDLLRKNGYYDDPDAVIVEKQLSAVEAIRAALAKAGKGGKGGRGLPEFIITSPNTPDMVVVIECKADVKHHVSPGCDKPVEYAVDGVLHYVRHLSPNYTTIAIAVSGNKRSNRWSFMLVPKGEVEPRELRSPTGAAIKRMVPLSDLIAAASFDPAVQAQRTRDLIQFSIEMHEFMRDEAEMSEQEKPLAVAGTLIALGNSVFRDTYDTCITVFTAGIPHETSNKKSWFGYWREDGFEKVKNLGRVNRDGSWPAIRDRWIESWRNREVHVGESVAARVGPEDEWVAEAYMETDYSTLTQKDLEKNLLDYALFLLRGVQKIDEVDE